MTETATRRIHDYSEDKVRGILVDTFKRRGREATLADLMADTALPSLQVREQLPAVADEYGARLRVTESGEILYSFPHGMRSSKRGIRVALKRGLRKAGGLAKAVLTWLFKTWIVVMLVGYFVIFLALLLLFIVGGTAASSGKGSSSRRSSGGNLIGSLLNAFIRIWFYSEFFKGPEQRYRDAQRRSTRRPLHKAVFSFVFGDGDPNAGWPVLERKALIAWLRSHEGIITLPEFMALSGRDREEAQNALNAYCLEFEGSPEASEEGVLYWKFPEIQRSADGASFAAAPALPEKKEIPFSSNPRKANVWFSVINGVNILFGSYFLSSALVWGSSVSRKAEGIQAFYAFVLAVFREILGFSYSGAAGAIALILGAVPLSFGVLFYLIPWLRSLELKRKNAAIAREKTRARVWAGILAEPSGVAPGKGPVETELLEEAAAGEGAEVTADPSGAFRYAFPEVRRAKQAAWRLRSEAPRDAASTGPAIFDTEGTSI